MRSIISLHNPIIPTVPFFYDVLMRTQLTRGNNYMLLSWVIDVLLYIILSLSKTNKQNESQNRFEYLGITDQFSPLSGFVSIALRNYTDCIRGLNGSCSRSYSRSYSRSHCLLVSSFAPRLNGVLCEYRLYFF